ncbi:MAG TPA: GNAT family N-acetyltransferase [Chloroflexota bacterium]|nr:GNAT family N-acetyltransferase [Chloroflexota bacterium]
MGCNAPCAGIQALDQEAFTSLAREWNELLQRAHDNRIFYTPLWYRVWWHHFGAGTARVYVARDDDGRLQGVLPLQVHESAQGTVVSIVGDYNVSDYMDAVSEKGDAESVLVRLWGEAIADLRPDRIELRHIPSTSPTIPALQRIPGSTGPETDEVCPVAILCSSWEGYLQMLTKKQRHEVRRKLRRAQEGADWSWRTVATRDDLERDLDAFFRLHEASTHDKARFMTPPMRAFFRALAAELLDASILRLSIYRRDGVDVAATMSFLYRDRWLLYNSGYDPAFAAHSPGIAAVAHAMQDAIEEKAVAFDFLSGDELYKYQLGATNTHTCRVSFSPSL